VFDGIERFYNPTRRHPTLGPVSPMAFEKAQRAQAGVNSTGSRPVSAHLAGRIEAAARHHRRSADGCRCEDRHSCRA
jgi:hypothetical protein